MPTHRLFGAASFDSRVPALAAVLALTPAAPAVAQQPYRGELAVEVTEATRWLHGSAQRRVTPFVANDRWLLLDSTRAGPAPGETVRYVRLSSPQSRHWMEVRAAPGRPLVTRLVDSMRPLPYRDSADGERLARLYLLDPERVLRFPEPLDLLPIALPTHATPGARWSDTVRVDVAHRGLATRLAGPRVLAVEKDTVIGGATHWIIRDSAAITLRERIVFEERTLGGDGTIERGGRGVLRGRSVVDPASGAVRARAESLAVVGESVVTLPDGRVFRTPVIGERTRTVAAFRPAAYDSAIAARRDQARRRSGGMVRGPADSLEARLRRNDAAARDSVFALWLAASDGDTWQALYRRLQQVRDAAFRARVDSIRAGADSAFMIERAKRTWPPLTTGGMATLLALMADPGIAIRLGLTDDPLYENVAQRLVERPPAVDADTGRWVCAPEACRMLAARYPAAAEPRLRQVALVAAAMLEPRRWGDTLLAAAGPAAPLLEPAAAVLRGEGLVLRGRRGAPLPAEEAPVAAWLDWLHGGSTLELLGRAPGLPPGVDERAGHAILMHELLTGRDVTGELGRRFRAATDDSTRLVFGAILTATVGLGVDVDALARMAQAGSRATRELVARDLLRRMRDGERLEPVDSATRVAIVVQLVRERVAADRNGNLHVRSDSVPPAVEAALRGSARFVTGEAWGRMPERGAATLLTIDVRGRIGPFVLVSEGISGRLARRDDEAPHLWASGSEGFYLLIGRVWVRIGDGSMWIT